jgi:putative DNA methylase
VLFASLVDDPSDVLDEFPDDLSQQRERQRLFVILEDLVGWKAGNNPAVLTDARREIARSLARSFNLPLPADADLLSFLRKHAPIVYDPFCGGGTIPLEALRLGLRVRASDLNPVAVLITKAIIELPARFEGLGDAIRRHGAWMLDEALSRLGHLYPPSTVRKTSKGDARILAWRWARTILCPNPACGATVPLVWSFSLSTGKAWIEPVPDPAGKKVRFSIKTGPGTPPAGTCSKHGARCLCCQTPIPIEAVRVAGRNRRMGIQLMAMVSEGDGGRVFLPPDQDHENIAQSVVAMWRPEDELVPNSRHVTPVVYGMTRHSDLYLERQIVTLGTLMDLVQETYSRILAQSERDDPQSYAAAVATYLALAVSRIADYNSTLCTWDGAIGRIRNTFSRQALPMTWDFVEANPLAESSGSFTRSIESVAQAVECLPSDITEDSIAFPRDASEPLPPNDNYLISTDPPYYDNVPYADLSDYFYVWLRRALQSIHPDLFITSLTPKSNEMVADSLRHGGKKETKTFFESRMRLAVKNLSIHEHALFPLTIIYAFKQSEEAGSGHGDRATVSTGWETMLNSVVHSGLQQHGTWPLRTELSNRMRSLGSNALASSIVLCCRLRPKTAPVISRREFVAALKIDLPVALAHLQSGNIAPVDLAQAAIGPGMAVYTRYAQVLDAEGRPLSVRDALVLINQTLDEVLAEQEGDFDADSRWALAWFEQSGFAEGEYGLAETLSKAKNTSVSGLADADILKSSHGKVRLLKPTELPENWDPDKKQRLTAWEMVHQLIRALESGGESAAATVARKLGSKAEAARELCYRLYTLCERKKRAAEAFSYNALVQSWPEITRLATERIPAAVQGDLLMETPL